MDQKKIIKATVKDKEQTQNLLNEIKDKPIFQEKIEAINKLFEKAYIVE